MRSNFQDLINGDKPILIDFHATWCGPCKALAPVLKEVAGKMGDKIRIVKIDVDKNQTLAGKFQVRGVPTLMLFKEGNLLWRQSGVLSQHQIESEITERI